MRLRDWLTRGSTEKSTTESFTNSDWQKEQVKVVAQTLKGDGFPLLVESVKHQIKAEWERAKSPDERERLHAELHGLKRLQKRIRGLIQEVER